MGRALNKAAQMKTAPQGRLTLQSGVPVMSTTQSAKTTLYYTPYVGDELPIYDGTDMAQTTFAELSVLTTDTAKSPAAITGNAVNDWFVWNDAGTIRLGHGPNWTSDTVRSAGTALVMVNGVLLNSVSITNGPAASRGTYVGTTRSNGSSQLDWIFGAAASGGTAGFLGVWNAYNRVDVSTTVYDNGAPYSYASATVRQARASAGNQVTFVSGLAEDAWIANASSEMQTVASSGAFNTSGIGLDNTAGFTGPRSIIYTPLASVLVGSTAPSLTQTTLGVHAVYRNEGGNGSANTFNASNGDMLSFLFRM